MAYTHYYYCYGIPHIFPIASVGYILLGVSFIGPFAFVRAAMSAQKYRELRHTSALIDSSASWIYIYIYMYV